MAGSSHPKHGGAAGAAAGVAVAVGVLTQAHGAGVQQLGRDRRAQRPDQVRGELGSPECPPGHRARDVVLRRVLRGGELRRGHGERVEGGELERRRFWRVADAHNCGLLVGWLWLLRFFWLSSIECPGRGIRPRSTTRHTTRTRVLRVHVRVLEDSRTRGAG
jgi:hypothetical protein